MFSILSDLWALLLVFALFAIFGVTKVIFFGTIIMVILIIICTQSNEK